MNHYAVATNGIAVHCIFNLTSDMLSRVEMKSYFSLLQKWVIYYFFLRFPFLNYVHPFYVRLTDNCMKMLGFCMFTTDSMQRQKIPLCGRFQVASGALWWQLKQVLSSFCFSTIVPTDSVLIPGWFGFSLQIGISRYQSMRLPVHALPLKAGTVSVRDTCAHTNTLNTHSHSPEIIYWYILC